MSLLLIYFVKVSVCLAIVYLFYQLLLRKLTFYNFNRWYLAGYTFLSFFIPLINITPVLEQSSFSGHSIVQLIPAMDDSSLGMKDATSSSLFAAFANWGLRQWLSFALLAGAAIFLFRFIFRCLSFFKMRRNAQLVLDRGMKLYQVNNNIIPFSFGNSVFINSDLHTEEELREIIRHEFVHVKQRHTIDIIWSEWLCIINWYNPFAWLLRSSIRQNLEFIADHQVLENGVDKKQYQYLLLKVIGNNHFSIAQKFNFSSLKKRIAMMNKLQSAKLHLTRFLFILPLLAVILISFRQKRQEPLKASTVHFAQNIERDTVPDPTQSNEKGYIINVIDDNGKPTLVIKDETGKQVDRLLLSKWNENESYYEEKYGMIPPPPPPVPPLPPGSPVPPKLPKNVKSIQYKYDLVEVWLKDGKKERYDLKVPAEKKAYEKKYGEMVPAPEAPVLPAAPSAHPAPLKTGVPAAPVAPVAPGTSVGVMKTDGVDNLASPAVAVAPVISATPVPEPVEPVLAIGAEGQPIAGEEDLLITISGKTTPQQLEEFKSKMKERGIELKFDHTEYKEGILVSISGSIKLKDNDGYFAATDFRKLILSTVTEGKRVYFKVNIVEKRGVI